MTVEFERVSLNISWSRSNPYSFNSLCLVILIDTLLLISYTDVYIVIFVCFDDRLYNAGVFLFPILANL